MAELDAQAIINYIGNAPKKTPVKVYLKGNLSEINFPEEVQSFVAVSYTHLTLPTKA